MLPAFYCKGTNSLIALVTKLSYRNSRVVFNKLYLIRYNMSINQKIIPIKV
jgi:hypothetical protein